ncbi:class I SAM-dependent methyltransferase [Halobacillus amylolyticus]|uniref:Class I SAM-dependent methyltransferase n=1 Tax=Halobacillus amylolyticus TaxID=2932259 RepID=A0ABY4H9Y8_9BACI|nr:class I SAM-dependent methyltransferase [Halobacillus amylolyticus]UOR11277.1 class I SAM-dependent methyltransferase [Halobacillus amylolyticus]
MRKLAEDYPNVQMTGVDINQDVVDHARSKSEGYPNISFEVGDIADWRPAEGFDSPEVILLHNIFHYIHPELRAQLLNHLYSYLKKDGLVSVITPINETEHGEAFSSAFNSFFVAHSNLFALPNVAELEGLAESCRFDLFDLDPIIKEGSWYTFWLTPSIRVGRIGRYQEAEGNEQTLNNPRQLTKSS